MISELGETATFEVDAPDDPAGEWWIDLRIGLFEISVAWRADQGFGIFTSNDVDYGARPDEVYWESALAAKRLAQLAEQWSRDGAIQPMVLGDVRRLVDMSQTAIAGKLGIGQAVISRLESRHDARLGTIVDYVRALGGELRLLARFDGFEVPVELAPRPGMAEAPLLGQTAVARRQVDLAVATLQDIRHRAANLVEQWTGSVVSWVMLKPAPASPLSQGAIDQPRFIGAEISLDQVISDQLLKADLSWADGRLQLMAAYDEHENFRSIHAAIVSTKNNVGGKGLIVLEVVDKNGALVELEITSDRPSMVVMQPKLIPQWSDLIIRLLVGRARG